MKFQNPKPENLSVNQSALWDAINASPHPLTVISSRSGYGVATIKNWARGLHEPLKANYENVMQTVRELEREPAKVRLVWKARITELSEYRRKNMSPNAIAKAFNTTPSATRSAIYRYSA